MTKAFPALLSDFPSKLTLYHKGLVSILSLNPLEVFAQDEKAHRDGKLFLKCLICEHRAHLERLIPKKVIHDSLSHMLSTWALHHDTKSKLL